MVGEAGSHLGKFGQEHQKGHIWVSFTPMTRGEQVRQELSSRDTDQRNGRCSQCRAHNDGWGCVVPKGELMWTENRGRAADLQGKILSLVGNTEPPLEMLSRQVGASSYVFANKAPRTCY